MVTVRLPPAPEHRVRLHVHPDVQVARGAAAFAGGPLARDLDPRPVGHSGRDAGRDGRELMARPLPENTRQGSSTTMPRPWHSLHGSAIPNDPRFRLVCPVPGITGTPRHGARLGPGTVTGRARALPGQPQRDRGAVDRVAEGQRGLGLHVGAPPRAVLRGRAAAVEHAAEDVAQAAVVPGATKDVTEVEAAEPALAARARCQGGTRKPPPNIQRASSYSLRRFSSDSTEYAWESP